MPPILKDNPQAPGAIWYCEFAFAFGQPLSTSISSGSFYEGIRRVLAKLEERTPPNLIKMADNGVAMPRGCKPRCNYCCHRGVTLHPAEVLAIAHRVRKLPEAESIKARAAAFAEESRGLSPADLVTNPRLCPLNVDGLCSVYEVRPLRCQNYHSFDLQECIRDFNAPGTGQVVMQHPGKKALWDLASWAIEAVCVKFGIAGAMVELGSALNIALEGGAEIGDVVAGKDVFARARQPEVDAYLKAKSEELGDLLPGRDVD